MNFNCHVKFKNVYKTQIPQHTQEKKKTHQKSYSSFRPITATTQIFMTSTSR